MRIGRSDHRRQQLSVNKQCTVLVLCLKCRELVCVDSVVLLAKAAGVRTFKITMVVVTEPRRLVLSRCDAEPNLLAF